MKIKELSKKYIGQSCIVEQDYKNNDGKVGHESIFITDIKKVEWRSNEIGWLINGTVCHIDRTPWFNEEYPFWDMCIRTSTFWSEKPNSDRCLEDADFEFLPKEVVLQRLKERIGELMDEEKVVQQNIEKSEQEVIEEKSIKKLKPKYVVKNNKSGKSCYALDVDLHFIAKSWTGPDRQFRIIFNDNIEQVKDVLNFDAIHSATDKKVVYDLNDSFDVYYIKDDNNTIEKVSEVYALMPQLIDSDYHTITGTFEYELLNIDTKDGYRWKRDYDVALKYAESQNPWKHLHERPIGDTGLKIKI